MPRCSFLWFSFSHLNLPFIVHGLFFCWFSSSMCLGGRDSCTNRRNPMKGRTIRFLFYACLRIPGPQCPANVPAGMRHRIIKNVPLIPPAPLFLGLTALSFYSFPSNLCLYKHMSLPFSPFSISICLLVPGFYYPVLRFHATLSSLCSMISLPLSSFSSSHCYFQRDLSSLRFCGNQIHCSKNK